MRRSESGTSTESGTNTKFGTWLQWCSARGRAGEFGRIEIQRDRKRVERVRAERV